MFDDFKKIKIDFITYGSQEFNFYFFYYEILLISSN